MTTAHAGTTTRSSRRDRRPAQWAVLTRLMLGDALSWLGIAVLVMLAVLTVGTLTTGWLGWELVAVDDLETLRLEVMAGRDGVRVVGSLFLLAGAAGIAAVVIPIVLASRTRVYVVSGATRRSVAVAQLVTVAVLTACVLLLTALVLLVVGRGVDGAMSLLRADGAGDLLLATVRGAASLLTVMLAGIAIVALFLRWPWWVGTVVLVVVFAVLPPLVALGWPVLGDRLGELSGWWASDAVTALVLAALYWWMVRRVPVP